MNAFNPAVFAASFLCFEIHAESVAAAGLRVNLTLVNQYDSDIYINAVAMASECSDYLTYLPENCISPEDEVDLCFPSLELSGISICRVTDACGVEVMRGMPFVLTDEQIQAINAELTDICAQCYRFNPDHNIYHAALPLELTEAWEELHLNKAGA